jgi:hypothetical protein
MVCLTLLFNKIKKSGILNQIVERKKKTFWYCVFKKLRFKNIENLIFQIAGKV